MGPDHSSSQPVVKTVLGVPRRTSFRRLHVAFSIPCCVLESWNPLEGSFSQDVVQLAVVSITVECETTAALSESSEFNANSPLCRKHSVTLLFLLSTFF